jgi:thioredoxin 1
MGTEIILTKHTFEDEVIKSGAPVLVDFWAPWCMPCRMLAPALEELSTDLAGKLKIGKVNVDEEPDLAVQYGIESIPAVFLFKGGEIVETQTGACSKQVLEDLIKPYV